MGYSGIKQREILEFLNYRNYAKVFNQVTGGYIDRALMICEAPTDSKSWLVTNGQFALLCEKKKLVAHLSAPILRTLVNGDTRKIPDASGVLEAGSVFHKAKLSEWRLYDKRGKRQTCLLTAGKKKLTINAVNADLISDGDDLWISEDQLLITNGGKFKGLVMMLRSNIPAFPEVGDEKD